MKPLNFSLAEALDFDYLTKEEIKEVILEYEHIKNVLEDSLGVCDPDEVIARVDQLEEEVRAAGNKTSGLLDDIRKAYEHRHGTIYDTDDEQLVKWVCEDINNAPDSDTLVIDGVDFDLLEKQRLVLYDLPRTEALEGIINMLETWSDRRRNR